MFLRFLRIVKERSGSAGEAPARRLCAIRSGSAQCYGEDGSLGHGVLSLYEDSGGNLWVGATPGCGDGSLVLRNSIRCRPRCEL